MAQLPQEFLTRMQEMLGDEFDAFLTSYDAPRTAGLRVNTKKCRTEDFPPLVPGTWKKIPWIPNGYFVPDGMRMGQSPLYAAGVFYLQEPSAMTPASRLPIEPGERVLDLCAAPGGKATELNARLKGTGLLVANDISNARAKALLRNLELFGSENVLVTNETPAGLADVFPGFFDKILVDAPCSGEGMFRKDEAVIGTWTPERPDFFADLQREITSNAVKMLRPGGLMMYSTCTFAPQEDEGTVSFLLENFPEMELIEMEGYEGFSKGNPVWGNGDPEIEKTVRIWPASQPFAVTLSADKFKDYMNLKADDERTEKYLHGETISVEPGETASPSGWKLVCVDGFGLGWGKLVNGTLKNKYPVGWRK